MLLKKLLYFFLCFLASFSFACSSNYAFAAGSSKAKTAKPALSAQEKEAQKLEKVQKELETFVQRYIAKANRLIVNNKNKPKIEREGKQFIAVYTEIPLDSVRVSAKKSTSKHCEYVGTVKYEERTYTSAPFAKAKDKPTDFQCTRIRKLTELPLYVKGKWEN